MSLLWRKTSLGNSNNCHTIFRKIYMVSGNKNYADAEFLVAKMDLTNEDAVDKA